MHNLFLDKIINFVGTSGAKGLKGLVQISEIVMDRTSIDFLFSKMMQTWDNCYGFIT